MKKETVYNKMHTSPSPLPEIPWNEYPRPKLKRDSFLCLNGKWDLLVKKSDNTVVFDSNIIVPFCPESLLSGVDKIFDEEDTLVYKKTFSLPDGFKKDKIILHFGAVDQIAEVFVNGNFVTKHVGGYTPFYADITDYVQEVNELVVSVRDNLSNLILPYGKQSRKRGGMWYTPVSGIWQTVWIESVPKEYVKDIQTTVLDNVVTITAEGIDSGKVILHHNGEEYLMQNGECSITIHDPVLWSPENPYLYYFDIQTKDDKVTSYFAIRTMTVHKIDGMDRICLNQKPYFIHALLDQGYWSDGLFTPKSPDLYTNEIKKIKALGFNTLRKHIKIEPQIFYYECDRLGVIVMQDMINNGKYSFFKDTALPTVGFKKKRDKNLHKNPESRKAFLSTMADTVNLLKSHPSVCYWTIFNEGWGQFESKKAYEILKGLDDTRIIDTTSGWFTCKDSDVDSLHVYFKKVKIKKSQKPVIVSEFGGITYAVSGHVFNPDNSYGYGKCETREDFVKKFRSLYLNEIIPAIPKGLCGAVYTQVSDIEDEINGLFTYDRQIDKITPKEFLDVSEKLKI